MARRIWLKVSCPNCGSIRVLREHIVVMITMHESSYAFTCCECHTVTERAAGPRILEVLLNTIVFDQPPITEFEVHQFAEALAACPDPLAELEA